MKLRALEPEDLDILYELENDIDLWSFSSTTAPLSRYSLKQYIASCKNDIFEDGQLRLAIDVNGTFAGLVDLVNFNPLHRRAEIGIVVCKQFRGQGIATNALHLLSKMSFDVLGLHQLYAIVSVDNNSSIRLFEKSEFNQRQILKNWLMKSTGNAIDAILFQRFSKT